jgi:uncharacterized membrane protein
LLADPLFSWLNGPMKVSERRGRRLVRGREGQSYFLLLAAIAVLVAAFMTAFVLDLNRNFLTSAADTSIYRNTLVNLLHGHGFRVTAYSGPSLLGQHSVFVLLLIAPLYALFPFVETLLSLQVWVVYSAVLPLYLIAREILQKPWAAFFVALLGMASPLFFQMAAAPFHTESGILAAILWSYYFYRRNRAVGFWISFGLAVSCAEQAGLLYAALGVALLCVDDGLAWRKRFAKFALIGGVAWLIFAVGLLIPAMYRPGQLNVMRYHYSQWDVQSGPQLIVAVAKNPLEAIQYLLSPLRWLYVLQVVGLPLGLAFLYPRTLILLAPFPFYFLLDDHEFFLDFHAYYFQFAFFAGYLALISFLERPGPSWRGNAILLAAAGATLLALYPLAQTFPELARGRNETFNATLRRAFATIPPAAAVYGPTRFSAYLSNRTNFVVGDLRDENLDLKAKLDAETDFTGVPYQQINYIVCDILNDQCGWRLGHNFSPELAKIRAANINRYIASGQWQIFWNQDNVVILRRRGA